MKEKYSQFLAVLHVVVTQSFVLHESSLFPLCLYLAQLIELVEVLGSHSIVAAELKQMIGALRTTESGFLPSYYYRLQQALCAMARNKEGMIPLSYFDLRQSHAHIIIPGLRQWPNTAGFSFHTWVCLDPPNPPRRALRPEMSIHNPKRRRILYRYICAS